MCPGDSLSETIPAVLTVLDVDVEAGNKPTSSAQRSVEIRGDSQPRGLGKETERGGAHYPPYSCTHLSMQGINHPGHRKSNRFAKCFRVGAGGLCRPLPLKVIYVPHALDSSTVRKAFLG